MRQRNHVEPMPGAFDAKLAADDFFQLSRTNELPDSQPANGNDEARPQNSDLRIQPRRAVTDLLRRRNAIGAARAFPRKTAAHRGEINFRANSGFIQPAELFEPAKQRFAGRMREGPSQNRFARPGAWPTIITSLTIAPPETGVDRMRGQRRQRSNRATCRARVACRSGESCIALFCRSHRRFAIPLRQLIWSGAQI